MSTITNDVDFTLPCSTPERRITNNGFSPSASTVANSDYLTASLCLTSKRNVHHPSLPLALPRFFNRPAGLVNPRPCPSSGIISATLLNAPNSYQPPAKIAASENIPPLLSQDVPVNGDDHPSSPLALPHVISISAELSDSRPCSRSSMVSANLFNPPKSHQPPAKSAVSDDIPSLLTYKILNIGDTAHSRYEVVRELHPPEVTSVVPAEPAFILIEPYRQDSELLLCENPFSNFSPAALEAYFAAAVDAKNALQLRQSVVAVDIGDVLERLLLKLSLYVQDGAVLETAFEELRLIEEVSLKKDLKLNFFDLESRRHKLPSQIPSVLEKHSSLFSEVQYHLNEKDDAQQAAHIFMEDPYALREHRLPYFLTSQR